MMAAEDREDMEEGIRKDISSSIRSAKKAGRPTKMTVVAPERDKGYTAPKKKSNKHKGGFDRELGLAGKIERENGGTGVFGKKPKRQDGGSAGKGKSGGFANKRAGKAGKRS